MILDKTVFVSRLNPDASDSTQESYVTFSGFNGTASARINIQPADEAITALYEGVSGKTYKAFTRASGIVETMRLTVSGTNEAYDVRGRQVYDYGVDTHYELILFKREPYNVP